MCKQSSTSPQAPLIGMLFMLREMGRGGRGGLAEREYSRLDWKLIKLATALHHSALASELSIKCTALQATITVAYRLPR